MDQLKRATKLYALPRSLLLALAAAVVECRQTLEPEIPARVKKAAALYGIKIKRR